jgi:hypothetical protein
MIGVLSEEWDDYILALREDAHILIAWGYMDTVAMLPSTRDEYDMTGLLADAMNRRIEDPLTPDRFAYYSVHNERPISPLGERGKRRPKLDIQIELCGTKPKRRYTFEAKRLRDDASAPASNSLDHYFGGEGVGRFIANRYPTEGREAAMVGFVEAHDVGFWTQRFERAFADEPRTGRYGLNVIVGFQPISVVKELPYEGLSLHRRDDGSTMRLLQIFLLVLRAAIRYE